MIGTSWQPPRGRPIASRCWRPIRSTSSTPQARPAFPKAWCATMAATPWRCIGRCEISTACSPTRCSGPPPMSAGWSAIPTLFTRRCSTAAPRSCMKASRSARPMPAPSGGSSSSTTCGSSSPRRPHSARSSARTPTGLLIRQHDLQNFRALFLAGERADPPTVALGRGASQGAGHRSLVADRNRVADRRQLPRDRAIAGQARLGDACRCRAGIVRVLDAEREGEAIELAGGEIGALAVKLPLPPGALPTLWQADDRFVQSYMSAFPGLLSDSRCRFHRRGRLYPRHDPHRRHHQCRRASALDRRDRGGAGGPSRRRRMRRDRRRRRAQGAGAVGVVGAEGRVNANCGGNRARSRRPRARAHRPGGQLSRRLSSSPACRRPGQARSFAVRCARSPTANTIRCRPRSTIRRFSARSTGLGAKRLRTGNGRASRRNGVGRRIPVV